MRCWCGYLSGAWRCRLFAHGPADATAISKPHNLLLHLNTDWCTFLEKRPLNWCSSSSGSSTGVAEQICLCNVHAPSISPSLPIPSMFSLPCPALPSHSCLSHPVHFFSFLLPFPLPSCLLPFPPFVIPFPSLVWGEYAVLPVLQRLGNALLF